MCTVTWLMAECGYELFCNRDELRTRQPARPPTLHEQHGVKFVAPSDGDFGGSWIAVNEAGLSLCLLNYCPLCVTPAVPFREHPVSRGLLLLSFASQREPDAIAQGLAQMNLAVFEPFLLLIVAPCDPPALLRWDGTQLTWDSSPEMPVTTSSFDTDDVIRARQEQFAQLGPVNVSALRNYHFSRNPRGGAYSVRMSRPDAQTVSFSHVAVTQARVEFEYRPLAAGTPTTTTTVSLRRVQP